MAPRFYYQLLLCVLLLSPHLSGNFLINYEQCVSEEAASFKCRWY